jgi:hypothetical protein
MKKTDAQEALSRPMRIDRDKLRSAVRRLGNEYIYYMLDDAIELLPPSKLVKLDGRYLDVKSLQASGPKHAGLLAEVKAFEKASRAGDYYESFAVNSKNCSEVSGGTRAWIAECERLFGRCVAATGKGSSGETCDALEMLFALLQHIDKGMDDVVFFADEGGSWQVGVDWQKVLPAWFTCLSATVEPDEYARRVVDVVDRFVKYDRDKHLTAASRKASAAQRKALAEKTDWRSQKTRKRQ